jgi:alkylation response protein AidB-like acyl-CoA dehydrogenase
MIAHPTQLIAKEARHPGVGHGDHRAGRLQDPARQHPGLENCRVPLDKILGGAEVPKEMSSRGFEDVMTTFGATRPIVAEPRSTRSPQARG